MTSPTASRGALTFVVRVAAWTVMLAVAGVLVAAVALPRLAGATPYTVLTGSMTPDYPPGTLVVVRPVEARDLRIGQVVTWQVESGRATVVTHRVIGTRVGRDGELEVITKGDANAVADPPVRAVQVRGRLWYAVPHLGRVNHLITGHQRQYAVWLVAALLVAYALRMFALSHRQRRSTRPLVDRSRS